MDKDTTWRILITEVMGFVGDTWGDVVFCTLSDSKLDIVFNDGYGECEGLPFTLWTTKHVYFPVCYDGSESVDCVSRNPNWEAKRHVGGG